MKIDDRKAAIAAYKKRKSAAGIYAVRCAPTGESWIGQTLNLETIQNRIWFSLRAGGHSNRELQHAWTAHGAGPAADRLAFRKRRIYRSIGSPSPFPRNPSASSTTAAE